MNAEPWTHRTLARKPRVGDKIESKSGNIWEVTGILKDYRGRIEYYEVVREDGLTNVLNPREIKRTIK